jgi:hypothetical protein
MISKLSITRKPIIAIILTSAAMLTAARFVHITANEASAAQPVDALDTQKIAQIIGRSGEMKDGMYKISLPRTDLKVRADGIDIRPALALGSWMAFKPVGSQAVVMGDLVLLENELNAVLPKLEANGIEVSAIHNHILNEQPRLIYMHFIGHGSEEKLASGLKQALSLSGTPIGSVPSPTPQPSSIPDWMARVQQIIGVQGRERGGVLQISVPRKEKITMADGIELPAFMGTATAINFQLSPRGAVTTGDFVMTAGEVNNVIRELIKAGIQITALHSHMLDESPRLFFMHFWGNDDAVKLARGLRAALEKTNSAL